MKIVHVVTLASPQGEFGGPTRVAINLAREQQDRGHEVVVAAGSRGFERTPTEIDGVRVLLSPVRTLIPGAGFSGLVSPGLMVRLAREFRNADIVHVHLARDLVTLPSALLARAFGRKIVIQPHGMVDRSEKKSAAVLDAVAVRRVMRAATAVLHLSEAERADLVEVFGDAPRYRELGNGVPLPASAGVVGRPHLPLRVVFVARLAARKRPALFIEAARICLANGLDASFVLYGPDEGEGDSVREMLAENDGAGRISWEGALEPSAVEGAFAESDILVNTTEYDPFPMSVLESLASAVPVVMCASSPLSDVVEEAGAGARVDDTSVAVAEGILRCAEGTALVAASVRARALAESRFSMSAVVGRLEGIYEQEVAVR